MKGITANGQVGQTYAARLLEKIRQYFAATFVQRYHGSYRNMGRAPLRSIRQPRFDARLLEAFTKSARSQSRNSG
jgi:hypothetical protein